MLWRWRSAAGGAGGAGAADGGGGGDGSRDTGNRCLLRFADRGIERDR